MGNRVYKFRATGLDGRKGEKGPFFQYKKKISGMTGFLAVSNRWQMSQKTGNSIFHIQNIKQVTSGQLPVLSAPILKYDGIRLTIHPESPRQSRWVTVFTTRSTEVDGRLPRFAQYQPSE